MGCCGQKRDSLRTQMPLEVQHQPARTNAAIPARAPIEARPAQPAARAQLLRYLRRSPSTVRGPATGRVYAFGPQTPLQPVDERDVPGLIATGAFAPA